MSSYYSPKEFVGFVGIDASTVGAKATTQYAVESDSLPTITYNDLKQTEQRANSLGRVLQAGDLQSHEPGAVHEVSMSGILDDQIFPLLMQNALGTTFSSNIAELSYNHNPDSFLHGASAGADKTLTYGIKGSETIGSNDVWLAGCVTDSLTISANANENGGRFTFDASAKSRVTATATPADTGTVTDYPSTEAGYLYLSDCTQQAVLGGQSVIIDSFSMTIENPVSFQGNKLVSTDKGLPEAYVRSVPAINITGSCTIKYDATSDGFLNNAKELTALPSDDSASSFLYIGSESGVTGHAGFTDSTGLGFLIPNGVFTEVTRDESDYMRLNCSWKAVGLNADAKLIEVLHG